MTRLDWFITIMPALVGIVYLSVAIAYLFKREYGWALVWACYAGANAGLIIVGLKQ